MFCLCFKISADNCNGHVQIPLGDIAQDKAQITDSILAKFGLKKGDCTSERITRLVKKMLPCGVSLLQTT